MSRAPNWNLERVERLVAEVRAAGVPAFADSWEDEAYLCVPVLTDTDAPLSRITVWWTGESWAVQLASPDGKDTWGDAWHAPDTLSDLPDGTIVALLLGAVIGNTLGAEAYGDTP